MARDLQFLSTVDSTSPVRSFYNDRGYNRQGRQRIDPQSMDGSAGPGRRDEERRAAVLTGDGGTMALEHEMATYQAHLLELLANEGKYAVVRGEEIAGAYDSYDDALQAGYDRYGLVPFLVKKISRVEPIQYFSRDLPRCQP